MTTVMNHNELSHDFAYYRFLRLNFNCDDTNEGLSITFLEKQSETKRTIIGKKYTIYADNSGQA